MVRFYKRIQDQWFYKECWQDGDRVIFHHGVVGNEGKVDSEPCLDFSAYYNSFKRKYEKQGYSEFSPDHAETIVLKYALKSSEEAESITKSVIPLLNERLGWLGLGYVDGYDVDVKRSIFRKAEIAGVLYCDRRQSGGEDNPICVGKYRFFFYFVFCSNRLR